MKTPIDWLDQATDDNGGANWMRFGTGMSNDWTNGGEFWNPESLHVYDDLPVKSMGMSFNKDNQWHEYALYLKMPTNADSEDGIIRCWEDSTGNYSITNANANYVDIDINMPWSHMISPHYYKGATDGNWTFWLDDVEIWDGLPEADLTPPSRSNPQPAGILSSGTTSTTISLDTDETATCKYSETAGTAYDSILNTFSNTNSTSHSQTITNLSDGETKTYYIRCQDESSNQNPDDFEISFSIASPSTTYSISNFIQLVTDWLKSESGLESDVNNDGVVNTRDLGIMMSNWGE